MIKYRNLGPSGVDRPCWTLAGGACEPGETILQTALREIAEETGMTDVRLGPVIWYGEDRHRSGDWKYLFKEHFIVAYATSEMVDRTAWTEQERRTILETRWWTLDELRASQEAIYPFGLARLVEPVLRGEFPAALMVLPSIGLD